MQPKQLKFKYLRYFVSMPFIYAPFIAMIILDIFMELYHRVGFPLYGMPYINRSAYIKIDRERMPFLTWYQKIHCLYCSYANGLFQYAVAIAGATEKYWCPLKHEPDGVFIEPEHQKCFAPMEDAEAFKKLYNNHDTSL